MAGSFRDHRSGGERQVRRAWVILEGHDGERVIAEVLPDDITLTTEGDLDYGGAPWYAAERVTRAHYISRLALSGVLVGERLWNGPDPAPAPSDAEVEALRLKLSGKARRAIEGGERH